MKHISLIFFIIFMGIFLSVTRLSAQQAYQEPHRPQLHFSPQAHWMNDPNGMVFLNGTYHLFYQYYPGASVWGPMHWGHATSSDLVHWTQRPIALYPDSLGLIFSGSAVADIHNTSGFGKDGKTPLVAIFTSHNMAGEKAGRKDFQNQSIAYSLDEGKTWTKYPGNPVIKNPGIVDFRDPKVRWFEPTHQWIMTLATKDRVTFYSSPDLKSWSRESDFGNAFGSHSGVWECPDLFPIEYKGKTIWVLTCSINPGGPNGGSATQYFTGTFNGHQFIPFQTDTRWVDYGKDNYAGVTWSNTGKRVIFLGWMSNWQYADTVPTQVWRSACTVPRDLSLEELNGKYYLLSKPVHELDQLNVHTQTLRKLSSDQPAVAKLTSSFKGQGRIDIEASHPGSFSFTLSNDLGEHTIVGYDQTLNQFYVDRTASGITGFHAGFPGRFTAPRLSDDPLIKLTLIIDQSSVELFADQGLSVLTDNFFPNQSYNHLLLNAATAFTIQNISYSDLKTIWP